MSKTNRSKKGRAAAGMTRNQLRKTEYAKMRSEGRGKRKAKHARDPRTGIHQQPCGNPACSSCYRRIVGYGIVLAGTYGTDA